MNFIINSDISKTKRQFTSFVKKIKRDKTWHLTNETLYKLCREYPNHKTEAEIIAKAMIIGRVYAASLERGDSSDKNKGDEFYRIDVFNTFKEFIDRIEIKNHLKKLNKVSDFEIACSVHSQFVKSLENLRDIQKISFASKYLHFHFPKSFYILDSRVKRSLPKMELYLDCKTRSKNPNASTYYRYVARFETVRKQIKKQTGIMISPRELDTLLIKLANSMDNN